MIAEINKIPLDQILTQLGIQFKIRGNNIELYDGGKKTDGWRGDLDRGIVSDFTGKGRASGDRLNFLCSYLGIEKRDGFNWFEKTFNLKNDYKKMENNSTFNPIKDKWDSLPPLNQEQIEYLKGRGIYKHGDWARDYNGRIAVAVKGQGGAIQSIQSRSISDEGGRYFLERNTDGDGVFAWGINPQLDYIFIVEGTTDFLSLRQYTTNVVGLINAGNKKQLSIAQSIIKRFNKVYLVPDNDEAGRGVVDEFKNLGIRFYLFNLDSVASEDVNDMITKYGFEENIINYLQEGADPPETSLSVALDKAREYKRLYEVHGGKLGAPSGYPLLDNYISGIIQGKVYLLMGYSNQGKTRFAYSLLPALIQQKKKIAFYSLEVDTGMLITEIIGAVYGKARDEVFNNIDTIEQHIEDLSEYLEVYDDIRSLDDIEHHIQTGEYDVVFIDFVQNIELAGDEYSRMTEVAQRLQKTAILTGTTIINISQVNNGSRFLTGAEMQPKGSGALFASSDVILSLWGRNGNRFITVTKNKYGRAGVNFLLDIDYELSKFTLREDVDDLANKQDSVGFIRK